MLNVIKEGTRDCIAILFNPRPGSVDATMALL
jgi:hypothetical protein